jgi:hypothetical protein
MHNYHAVALSMRSQLCIVHYDYGSSIRYFSIVRCSLIRKSNILHFDKFLELLLTK